MASKSIKDRKATSRLESSALEIWAGQGGDWTWQDIEDQAG